MTPTRQQLRQPVTTELFKEQIGIVASVTRELDRRLKTAERRIAELEARPEMKYLGVFKAGRTYSAGSCVTFQGAVWHCAKTTTETPGKSADWTLAVKAGRDGKDAPT